MPRSQAAAKATEEKAKVITRTQPVRSRRRDVDTRDERVGQDKPRNLRAAGKARKALDSASHATVERVHSVSKEKLELLQFMEDVLTVMVHQSTNPLDEPFPEVWNDGICQRFQRGVEMKIKRKYIEVLARAKKTGYAQEELPNRAGFANIPSTALKYPFSVLQDPSPRGAAWLKSILAEG